jgi:hypothetical protein
MKLTFNVEQAYVLRDALESYSRMKAGQFDTVIRDLFRDRYCQGDFNHENTDNACRELKLLVFPELNYNTSYGVGSRVYPEGTIAWDIMQVIRHKLAWDKLEGEQPKYFGVQYGTPMKFSDQPLPEIESCTITTLAKTTLSTHL